MAGSRWGKRPVLGQGMGEEGGIEVEAGLPFSGPVDPALKLDRGQGVSFHFLSVQIRITGVQIETMPAGQEGKNFVQVLSQFLDRPRLAGIVSGCLEAAAAQGRLGIFKTADIIPLPAVKRKRHGGQFFEDTFGLDAIVGIALTGECVKRVVHRSEWTGTAR
jgi:hypothetical protein